MSFAETPAFSSAAITFPMRVVASALARARLGSCASTPTTTRPRSGEAVARPSPEAWTVRGAFGVGSGGAWARSTTAARTGTMVSSRVSVTPYATPPARSRRPTAPPALTGTVGMSLLVPDVPHQRAEGEVCLDQVVVADVDGVPEPTVREAGDDEAVIGHGVLRALVAVILAV